MVKLAEMLTAFHRKKKQHSTRDTSKMYVQIKSAENNRRKIGRKIKTLTINPLSPLLLLSSDRIHFLRLVIRAFIESFSAFDIEFVRAGAAADLVAAASIIRIDLGGFSFGGGGGGSGRLRGSVGELEAVGTGWAD